MSQLEWQDEFETGISVIDSQHKRIIHYINQLHDAERLNDPQLTTEVLINLIDYTLSHFAFEESLMEDAGYRALDIHKRTHDAFREKIKNYQQRHINGEDVTHELFELLNIWLINHIAEDDNSYAPTIRENMPGMDSNEQAGWLKQKIQRFFQ